jgi:hypothetical protein
MGAHGSSPERGRRGGGLGGRLRRGAARGGRHGLLVRALCLVRPFCSCVREVGESSRERKEKRRKEKKEKRIKERKKGKKI